jgi:hypothetical protein
MFRHPRENASLLSPPAPFQPSTGRPPTPPRPSSAPHKLTRPLPQGATTSTNTPVARAAPPNAMRATKKTQVTPVNGKLRPKPNSSILSFFTKTESPSKQNTALAKDEDEGLFIGDISMKADGQLNGSPEILAEPFQTHHGLTKTTVPSRDENWKDSRPQLVVKTLPARMLGI